MPRQRDRKPLPPRGGDAEYERFIRRFDHRLHVAIRRLARTGDVDRFEEEFTELVEELHLGAVWRGRIRGSGDRSYLDIVDRAIAHEAFESQLEYIAGFIADIRAGLFDLPDGRVSLPGLRNRGRYYLERARGTANEVFASQSPDGELFYWDLGVSEHCSDCLHFAAISPMRSWELVTQPGRCETICRSKCHCNIRRASDGMTGFAYVDPYGKYKPARPAMKRAA